jgi:pyruvate carboxylase
MEDINPICAYCGHAISSQEVIEIFGGQCFHQHCMKIAGVEIHEVPWERMTTLEQDAINLYLSQESYMQQECE